MSSEDSVVGGSIPLCRVPTLNAGARAQILLLVLTRCIALGSFSGLVLLHAKSLNHVMA